MVQILSQIPKKIIIPAKHLNFFSYFFFFLNQKFLIFNNTKHPQQTKLESNNKKKKKTKKQSHKTEQKIEKILFSNFKNCSPRINFMEKN